MATDTDGQEPAKQHLVNSGYTQIKQINHPVDFTAVKDGELYYIELKYITTPKKAFGNTPMTEWICAMENLDNFLFLVVSKPGGIEAHSDWNFFFVTPEEMLEYSYISPFKINFHFPLTDSRNPPNRKSTTIVPTFDTLDKIARFYSGLKN